MAYYSNGKNGRSKWWWSWSWKQAVILICSINIFVALYVFHSLYSSLYLYPFGQSTFKYTTEQIRKMEESNQIRKSSEPTKLIKLVSRLNLREERVVELPQHIKQMITNEILMTLRALNTSNNSTMQQEAVENWRIEKLKETKKLSHMKESDVLVKALESDWAEFLEEAGFWVPLKINNTEYNDKPDGIPDLEEDILPGRKMPQECRTELHTDYGGTAVRWGLTHHKDSAYDCCMSCIDQAKNAKPGENKCNIWVYCPSETGCYSPDIYQHKNMECWLKYAENPKVSFKDQYSETYRYAHPNAPVGVPWVSGVISF